MLVSKAIVDGTGSGVSGRYTLGQRHRFYREGVRGFLRLTQSQMKIMGGAASAQPDTKVWSFVDDENKEVPDLRGIFHRKE